MEGQLKKKNDMLHKIRDYRRSAIRNKAILSFKYDYLICRINFIQVSVIFVSAIILFLETIKMQLKLDIVYFEIVSIVLTTYNYINNSLRLRQTCKLYSYTNIDISNLYIYVYRTPSNC